MTETFESLHDSEKNIFTRGLVSCALGYILVAISPVVVADSNVHGLTMAFWRCWIGFGALAIVILIRKDLSFSRFFSAAPAGICFGSSMGLYFWAAQLTSILNASLITLLLPIPLTIAAYFLFSEKLTRVDIVISLVTISGAMLLVAMGNNSGAGNIKGDLLAVVSIFISAGYFISAKKTLVSMPLIEFMAGVFAWGGLTLVPMVLVAQTQIGAQSNIDLFRILLVAFIPGIGHLLLNYSQGKAPLNLIAVFQLIVPVVSTLLAYWILSQTVSTFQAVGMAVVIVTLGINALRRSTN
ncbi:MAG: DMT family transporter [Acidimicrobiales bacterium]|nr:DMT family transporter [Acidimicrobiales bacterium]